MATISYTFFGNGNSSYNIGSLVDWHESGLLADQLQVLLDDVEQSVSAVNGYTIDETNQTITFYSSSAVRAISGSEEITLNRVTPNTFFSTIETLGAASGSAALSNDKQLLNRIQEVENDIVVAQANSTIKDHQDNLVSIIKPGSGVGFSFNAGDGSLTISASGSGGSGSITIDFEEGIGEQTGSSFVLSQANTGFLIDSDLDPYVTTTSLNTTLNDYIQVTGFTSTYFTPAFNTAITPYTVKSIVGGTGITATTSAGVATIDLDSASTVTSVNGEIGDVLIDLRDHEDGDVISNHTGLKGCDHDSTEGVTDAGSPTAVDGWAWIHDQSEGSMITHKPLSGTRDSELTGGKTLTISGTLSGDSSDNEIDLASTTKIVATAKPTKSTHIPNIAYDLRRTQGFRWVTDEFDAYTPVHANATAKNKSLLLPISGQATDPLSEGGTNGVYRYPTRECYDNTAYLAPGEKSPVSNGVAALYIPGVNFHPLEGSDGQAYSEASQYATTTGTGGYFTTMSVTEPLPSSGNINSDAPLRIFNPIGFTDPTSGTANKFGKRNIRASASDIAVGDNFEGFVNSDRDYPYIIYVPASDNGGFVTVSATFNSAINEDDPGYEILLFTGMDEGNTSFGTAASIIPVATKYTDTNYNTENTSTLSYTYLNNDSKPRYFGFTKRVSNDNSTSSNKLTNVTVQRGGNGTPDFDEDFHSVMTGSGSIPANRRAWDDKFVAAQVAANFVAQ